MTTRLGVDPCPACGHHTSAAVAGCCTVFVPLPPGAGALAGYCGCDCLRAVTGESWQEGFARAMWGDTGTTTEGDQ